MKKRKKKQRKIDFHRQSESKVEENITIFHSANAEKPVGKVTKSSSVLVHKSLHCEIDELDKSDELQVAPPLEYGKTEVPEKAQNVTAGRVYPFDLWDVLSRHIKPEQVSLYARLCKGAYHSVYRVSFWLNLYQKYVLVHSQTIPHKLRPKYVNAYCSANLRLQVVKALHFVYEPLMDRLKQPKNKLDPHLAVGMICQNVWTVRYPGGHYQFNFKMNPISSKNKFVPRSTNCDEILDDWEDFQSPTASIASIGPDDEETCKVLQLDCDGLSYIPSGILGLRILDFNVIPSGEGFCLQTAKITLGPAHLKTTLDYKGRRHSHSASTICLTIGNCLSIGFQPWFHPRHSC